MSSAAACGNGRGDADVDEVARQLEGLNVAPQPSAPLQKPAIRRVHTEGRRFVYFDLETTGFGRNSHITQIAACSGDDQTFSSFVLPKIPISEGAQQVTGITCDGQQMYHHGHPVPSQPIRAALEGFIGFLEGEPAVIVGHNIQRFDCPILLNALQACGLVQRFQEAVHGCVDTLPLLRQMNSDVENHRLATLYKYYTGQEFPAHDARQDVQALQEIVDEASPSPDDCFHHSFAFDHIIEVQRYQAEKARLLPAWLELVERGVTSKHMADKASGTGLSWDHVCQTFQRDGEERVREMLKERLTNRHEKINSICQYLRGEWTDNA